jgi:hypothetical protein
MAANSQNNFGDKYPENGCFEPMNIEVSDQIIPLIYWFPKKPIKEWYFYGELAGSVAFIRRTRGQSFGAIKSQVHPKGFPDGFLCVYDV